MIYEMDAMGTPPTAFVPETVTALYALVLNPMSGRAEEQRFVAASESRTELEAYWNAEKVEPYSDGQWRRNYRAGGPLEWFNPPFGGHGTTDGDGNGIVELRRDGWRRVA